MGKHRLEPARRVQPRYGRIAAAALSVAVTLVALLGGIGVLPLQTSGSGEPAAAAPASTESDQELAQDIVAEPARTAPRARVLAPASDRAQASTAVPAGSGSGRRAVFAQGAQRVWLVDESGELLSTYLVSGSLLDNLQPGSYEVFSRSRWARGIDDSGVMEYFVRFAHGKNAAIGFHSIPTKDGRALQTEAQLGTPQSHGCIRQRLSDAQRMWDFADVGTKVVVVA